ncbi:GNAT family N-acetyltransferase [Lacibacter sp. H375]|uniref:GNAT family N-acetyltransferase n=1 Tax=Lacibacter sp. H375 TaxID=3133424 RepID=UPI0030C21EBF
MSSEHITVSTFEEIDKEQFCMLHSIAFKELIQQSKISEELFTVEHYTWKYNSPAGKAKIAVIQQHDKLVGSVSMFPVTLIKGNRLFTAWNAGDVAVLPEYRGKFFFNQCMNALKKSSGENDFLFGFPNHNNLAGATRSGFKYIKDLQFYIKPYFFTNGKRLENQGELFSALQDQYAETLARGRTMILRSSAYMKWRYLKKPGTNYLCYTYNEGTRILGNVVVRVVKRKSIKVLVVMEYHYIDRKAISFLNRFIGQSAIKNKCVTVVMLSARDQFNSDRTGFFRLPELFQPKKMVFYGNPLKEEDKALLNVSWFIQTGDWDAF